MTTENIETSIYKSILDLIADGHVKPGDWLREADIAKSFESSRTPVRVALRQLSAEGIVEFIPNRGARVRSWTSEELEKTYKLRAILEGLAAQEVALLRTEENVLTLRYLANEFDFLVKNKPANWIADASIANDNFHKYIISCSRLPLIDSFVRSLHSVAFVRRSFHGYTNEDVLRSSQYHKEIVDAIERANAPLVESLMKAHILSAISPAGKAWQESTEGE